MRGAFDDEEDFEQRKSSGDAEFTLGAGTMLLLFAGLVAVCGICFGFGYMLGRRGPAPQAATDQTAVALGSVQQSASQQKPSATAQAAAPATAQSAMQLNSASPPAVSDSSQSSAAVAAPISSAPSAMPAAAPPQVRPAMPAVGTEPEPSNIYTSRPAAIQAQSQVRPVPMPPTAALWVQVAAVSHVEDAQVLTTALRKRGYTVTPRREADNLIHVRIGPFTTNDEANRWRVKLLGDGYNAEIQQ